MKRRQKNSHVKDEEHIVSTESVKTIGVEKRDRHEYYGLDTLVEQFPDMGEDELLRIWETRVKNATHVIEQGGLTFIPCARKY